MRNVLKLEVGMKTGMHQCTITHSDWSKCLIFQIPISISAFCLLFGNDSLMSHVRLILEMLLSMYDLSFLFTSLKGFSPSMPVRSQ